MQSSPAHETEEADGNLNKVSAGSIIHGIARMMNRITMYAVWCILALQIPCSSQQVPFHRGVNVTEWFQADSADQIQFTRFTKKDFEQLKSLGVDVVRLPINLHSMTSGAPEYTLDPLFLYFIDQVADWTEALQLHLILDNHSFDVTASTDTAVDRILIPVWGHMAAHFKNRSALISYEVLNEPHGISDARWNAIQQSVVDAIRAIDTVHTIIVGPGSWNSYNNLAAMPVYRDTNLIYTFHFYDPFLFTHQGASWTDLVPLTGVPFPYNAQLKPVCPPSLVGTWVQSSLKAYGTEGTVQQVQSWLNIAVNFQRTRHVPIYCGELGVYMQFSSDTDRVFWYHNVRTYLEQYSIPWTTWDYKGSFGLFKKNSDELFDHDINIPLVTALGLMVPGQTPYVQLPDTAGFVLYSDYVGPAIEDASYKPGTLNFYCDQNPAQGQYCIYWTGASQYQVISFDFIPNKDLSLLKMQGYALDFKMKGNDPNTAFDIRFLNPKTGDPNGHPWRMRYTIDTTVVKFNNEWQHLQIPLARFTEHGAWDNGWYNPMGLFDWKNIDRFEIDAEYSDMTSKQLWFDDIKIINPQGTAVANNGAIPSTYELLQNYPNPFNPSTGIRYRLPSRSVVTLKIFNVLGMELATLVDGIKEAGSYEVQFNATRIASGVYFYRLTAGHFTAVKKLVLVK